MYLNNLPEINGDKGFERLGVKRAVRLDLIVQLFGFILLIFYLFLVIHLVFYSLVCLSYPFVHHTQDERSRLVKAAAHLGGILATKQATHRSATQRSATQLLAAHQTPTQRATAHQAAGGGVVGGAVGSGGVGSGGGGLDDIKQHDSSGMIPDFKYNGWGGCGCCCSHRFHTVCTLTTSASAQTTPDQDPDTMRQLRSSLTALASNGIVREFKGAELEFTEELYGKKQEKFQLLCGVCVGG